jgi:hypothetical protein
VARADNTRCVPVPILNPVAAKVAKTPEASHLHRSSADRLHRPALLRWKGFDQLAGIFERAAIAAQSWHSQSEKLRGDRLLGRIFAASRAKLRESSERRRVPRVIDLRGCPIR